MSNPTEAARCYQVERNIYKQYPLSFWELLDMPDVFSAIAGEIKEGEILTAERVMELLKSRCKSFFAMRLNISTEELKDIPAETGMEIIADFAEMNLTENFIRALNRAIPSLKGMLSALLKSLESTGTAGKKSAGTQ